jgi:molybdate transport system permease protein
MMELWPAIRLSLSFGFIATLINLIPAVALGFFLARKTFPGKSLVEGIVSLPLVIPPVSLGFLLLLLLGRNGLLGGFFSSVGISIAFTSLAGVIASAVVSFPLVVKNIRTAVEMTDRRLEEAASSLGAPPLGVFFRIILPQIWPGVLGGLVLGFTRALGEFGATMVFAGNIPEETRSIPLAVYSALQVPGEENTAIVLVSFSIVLSLAALILSNLLQKAAKKTANIPQIADSFPTGQCQDPEDGAKSFGGVYGS